MNRPNSSSYYYQDGPANKGMFSEDEDSRDSGIGDVEFCPSSLKGTYCGEQLFILDEEMEDLSLDENAGKTFVASKKTQRVRIFGDITNGPIASPVSRKSGFSRNKSSMVRKRTLPNLDYQVKRQKDPELTENIEPESKPTSGRRRSLLRAFSTSTLEVHLSPTTCDDLPQPLVVNYSLPTVIGSSDSVAFKRIEASTLSELILSLSITEFHARYILVDCRYPYEYEGGHIQNAINLFDPNQCERFFFGEDFDRRRIPIFYCEYSQKRGPNMAHTLRGADRLRNVDRYPAVTFEEIYVLDKGYKGFFEADREMSNNQSLCSPCNYVTMDDPQYSAILRTYAFHKRYSAATCVKSEKPKFRAQLLARQTSHESPIGRRPTRRPLFGTATSSPEPLLEPLRLTYSPDNNQS